MSRISFVAAFALLSSFTIFPVLAQETSASITGKITDPSGAPIGNATVKATDEQRGTIWPTTTNADGIFVFPRIPVGTYEVRVEAAGFKTSVRPHIGLELNARDRIDLQMEIGALTENVTVAADSAILQTDTTQVGEVLNPTTIINTPLISRNYIALALLIPGVQTPNPAGFNSGARSGGGGRPYVNGNREEANNFLLDGIDNNQVSDNLTAYQPSVDAIAETKILTNNAPAEFGNFQGGIINVGIKSGTNQYHGDLFEFFRNDKLNANNWGRNWSLAPDSSGKAPRPALRSNIFGGTFGGPVIKDRLFFFVDYQGTRIASPGAPSAITVVPAAFRVGDFSALLPGSQIYDPSTTDANGNRQPFVNNQIPLSRINPVALKLFNNTKLYPLPINNGLSNNAINVGSSYTNTDQGDVRVDAKASQKDDVSVRYSKSVQDQPSTNSFPLFYNGFSNSPFQAGVVNWTRTIGPTLVNEARVGINRIVLVSGGADKGLGDIANQIGIAGVAAGLPSIQFANSTTSNFGSANIGVQTNFADVTFHYADNLTIVRGRHLMKAGGQILRQRVNTFYAGNNGRTGFIRFSGQYTQGPNFKAVAKGSGYDVADFFLGAPNDIGRGLSTGTWGQRSTIYGAYFQDDWRVTDTLTLNLGLRWEYHTPLVEVEDRQSNFSPFSGTLELAGKDGNSRALYQSYKKDFQPRVGFAWTPKLLGGKTVLRGAYTISSFMEGSGTNLRLPLNPPFNTEFETIYQASDPVIHSTTDQGLTVLQSKDPYKGATIRLWDPFVRPAETQQWNFTAERELPGNIVLSAGYVGQHGTHLIVPMPYFQRRLLPDGSTLPSQYLSGNPALATIAQISGTESDGNQRYDSLQVSGRKRLSAGLEFQASYTWSKGMSDAIGYYGEGGQAGSQSAYWQNLYNRKAEWGPTYFDLQHNFTFSYVYELPFGKSKQFGSGWNPLVNGVLGGWQTGGILSLHTGFPITIQDSDRSGTNSRGARADRVADGNDGPKTVGPDGVWFNTSAFQPTKVGTFGNSGVGIIRGPGLERFDLSLQKQFAIRESKRLEFRAETFNLTNTPTFSSPNRNVNSSQFGQIRGSQGERNVQFALKLYF